MAFRELTDAPWASLRPCCRLRPKPAGPGWMTARSSTGSCMSGSRAADGAICHVDTVPIRPPGSGTWIGGIRWGRCGWRRQRSIPRLWRRKEGHGVNREGLPLSGAVGPGNAHDVASWRRRGGLSGEERREGAGADAAGGGRWRWSPGWTGDSAGVAAAGDSGQPSEESAEGEADPRGKAIFLRSEGRSGGSKPWGAVLRVAERRVPKADGSARKAAGHLPRLRLPRLLPHRLEDFELSSILIIRSPRRPGTKHTVPVDNSDTEAIAALVKCGVVHHRILGLDLLDVALRLDCRLFR